MKNEFDPEGVNKGILKIDERRKFIEFKEIEIHEIRNRRKIEMNNKKLTLLMSQIELDEESEQLQKDIDEGIRRV